MNNFMYPHFRATKFVTMFSPYTNSNIDDVSLGPLSASVYSAPVMLAVALLVFAAGECSTTSLFCP